MNTDLESSGKSEYKYVKSDLVPYVSNGQAPLYHCRRSPVLTKAGPWTAWFCAAKWPSGWRMTSRRPHRKVSTSTGCIWMEPAGTAGTADSSTPSPKCCLRWCPSSGCTPRTMVMFKHICFKKDRKTFFSQWLWERSTGTGEGTSVHSCYNLIHTTLYSM